MRPFVCPLAPVGIQGFTERPQGSDTAIGYNAMTTLKQEWALIAQDQGNATRALCNLCEARALLHAATLFRAFVYTQTPEYTFEALYYLREAGKRYSAAKAAWLEASA